MHVSQRARELVDRFVVFNNEMITFVENCSEENWRKDCSDEGWTVGVVARHIAAGHYYASDLVKMIVAGEPLPDLGMETINQMNAQHAQEHADCTQREVLGILRDKGAAIVDYLGELDDADLDRSAHLALMGGEISAKKLIEVVIIRSGSEHLASMKRATA
jgi:hypothetical protein